MANSRVKSGSAADLTGGMINTVASFDAYLGQLPESNDVDRFDNFYLNISPLRKIWKSTPQERAFGCLHHLLFKKRYSHLEVLQSSGATIQE